MIAHKPTLATVLAVRPAQLTSLTPVEIDRMNLVLWTEVDRREAAVDRAEDRLFSALLIDKESVRHGRGWRQVWPVSVTEAERLAREHLDTGYEISDRDKLMRGLHGNRYAEQLAAAVDTLVAGRAAVKELTGGPVEVLDDEYRRRGGWSRMHLCLTDGGHIHTGRECPSIGPSTQLAWLPEVSGMDWREAFETVIAKSMAGSTQVIMCTKCYRDAPTEWTEKQADPNECPMSRKDAFEHMTPKQRRLHRKYATCPGCQEGVSVTSAWKFRKHGKPQRAV
jgi:hypothetical protein